MHKIKKLRNHLIINIGSVYNLEGKEFEVITATSEIAGDQADALIMTESVYWLKDVETKEMKYVSESELKIELPKYNEVVALF